MFYFLTIYISTVYKRYIDRANTYFEFFVFVTSILGSPDTKKVFFWKCLYVRGQLAQASKPTKPISTKFTENMYLRQCIRTRDYLWTLLKNHPLFRQTKQNQFTLWAKISISFDKISVEIGLYDLVYKSSPKNALNQACKLLKLFWENSHQLFIFTQIFAQNN